MQKKANTTTTILRQTPRATPLVARRLTEADLNGSDGLMVGETRLTPLQMNESRPFPEDAVSLTRNPAEDRFTKPASYSVFLECLRSNLYWQWHDWVGFRKTRYGFSVWVGLEGENEKIRKRVIVVKESYSWRLAARQLLNLDEGFVDEDLRTSIRVSGESGWVSEILTLCWMREDGISVEIKEFLIELDDQNLELLSNNLRSLILDETIDLLGRYIEVDSRSPLECWNLNFSAGSKFSFDTLVSYLEQKFEQNERAAAGERDAKLKPFKYQIDQICSLCESNLRYLKFYGRVSSRFRRFLEEFVLQNERVPEDEEINNIVRIANTLSSDMTKW